MYVFTQAQLRKSEQRHKKVPRIVQRFSADIEHEGRRQMPAAEVPPELSGAFIGLTATITKANSS